MADEIKTTLLELLGSLPSMDPKRAIGGEELRLDSLALLELVEATEQRFSIRFTEAELIPSNFDSLDRLRILIESKMRAGD